MGLDVDDYEFSPSNVEPDHFSDPESMQSAEESHQGSDMDVGAHEPRK